MRRTALIYRIHHTLKKHDNCTDIIELLDPFSESCSFKINDEKVKVHLTNDLIERTWFTFKSNYEPDGLPDAEDWCDWMLAIQLATENTDYTPRIALFSYEACQLSQHRKDRIFNLQGRFHIKSSSYLAEGDRLPEIKNTNFDDEVRKITENVCLAYTDLGE